MFGGKLRRIYAYVDPSELHHRGLSPMMVQKALKEGNPMIPPGTIRLDDKEWLVDLNSMPEKVLELNSVPVKADATALDPLRKQVHVENIGKIADAAAIQTNLVRIRRAPTWEGKQTVYIPIMRRPGSNTIEVVEGVKKSIPTFLDRLPPREGAPDSGLKLDVVADQSIYVRSAVNSLLKEGLLGAGLASLMVLIFIGSFRSTVVIALTIPLSALVAVIGLLELSTAPKNLRPGMYGYITITVVDDPKALLIPVAALLPSDQPAVMIVEAGRAQRRNLELGLLDGPRAQVLQGLNGDEQIIIPDGKTTMQDGEAVQIAK